MLEELPVDAFRPLQRVHRTPLAGAARPGPARVRPGPPDGARQHRPAGRRRSTGPAAGCCSPASVAVLLGAGGAWSASALFGWHVVDAARSRCSSPATRTSSARLVLLGAQRGRAGLPRARPRAGHQARRPPGAGGRLPRLLRHPVASSSTPPTCGWPAAGPGMRHHRGRPGHRAGARRRSRSSSALAVPDGRRRGRSSSAFAWYLNALFNLNPFLALDGYYLLMDWLEVPNLRARGLAWVVAPAAPPAAALRRSSTARAGSSRCTACSPSVWLVIAVNLGLPDLDRPGRRAGHRAVARPAGRPACCWSPWSPGSPRRWSTSLAGWLAAAWRGCAGGSRERQRRAPTRRAGSPRCARSSLRRAARAGPGRPRRAGPLGAPAHRPAARLRRRRPARRSTSSSTARWRAAGPATRPARSASGSAPGGVVGLASALTGAPAALTWHTAGTTLLAVPAPAVAARGRPAARPATGRAGRGRGAVRRDAGAGRAVRRGPARPGLRRPAEPVTCAPGAPVILPGPTDAVVVASGVGHPARRHRAAPRHADRPDRRGPAAARSRTPAPRAAVDPAGRSAAAAAARRGTGGRRRRRPAPARAPAVRRAPAAPATRRSPRRPGRRRPVDDDVDRRFERRLWWLLLLLLLFALCSPAANLCPGPGLGRDAHRPGAAHRRPRGTTVAVVDGTRRYALGPGDEVYVAPSDSGHRRATSRRRRLTFRGGGAHPCCAPGRSAVDRRRWPATAAAPIAPGGRAHRRPRPGPRRHRPRPSAAFAPLGAEPCAPAAGTDRQHR